MYVLDPVNGYFNVRKLRIGELFGKAELYGHGYLKSSAIQKFCAGPSSC